MSEGESLGYDPEFDSPLSDYRVVDMVPLISQIGPEASQFKSMLLRLGGRPSKDSRLWDDWRWMEYSPEAYAALDWYEEQFGGYSARTSPKVEWLEDELFPRVQQITWSDHPHLRAGDIVTVVGSRQRA
jgi:hypothetical protein